MGGALITSCTNRKRVPPLAVLRAADLKPGGVAQVAHEWTHRLQKAIPQVAVSGLYCGRSFREAESAAAAVSADFYVASAGLGLVNAATVVPSYSLTVASGSQDNVLALMGGIASPAEWWHSLVRRSPFSTSLPAIAERNSGPILIALPFEYLRMLEGELTDLPLKTLRRLRVFTGASNEKVPAALRPCVMPYDARLDGKRSPIPGTRGDFAQRAAHHFACEILPRARRASAAVHAEAVAKCLAGLPHPRPQARTRLQDAEITALINRYWNRVGGRSSRMLRFLRDDLRIACEQGRFRDLFAAVRAKRGK